MIQFVGTGTNRVAGLLFVAMAIRLLGAAGFGVYRQIAQLLITTSTIAMLGFDGALLRSVAQARARRVLGAVRSATRTAVTTVTIVSLVLFLGFYLAADPIAAAFADQPSQEREMAFLLRLGAAFVPLFALAKVLSTGAMGFKTVVPSVLVADVLQPVSLLLLSTLAIVAGYGVAGAVGALLGSAAVALVAASWFFRGLVPEAPREPHPTSSFRSMAAFGLPRAGSRAMRWGNFGTLILGIFGTDRDVALFAVATSLQGIVFIFPQAFISIWQPIVVDLVERKETERLGTIYQTVNRWVASCSFGLIVSLVILPEPFVRILGGTTVQEATVLTSVIAMGTLFQVGTGLCGALVTMAGYPITNLVNSIGIWTLYISAAWLIVPHHGVMGMAVIHSAAGALSNLVMVLAARWLIGIQPYGRSFLKPIAATCAAGVVLLLWRGLVERSLYLDLLGLALAGAAYTAALWVTGMDAEDRIVYERVRVRLRGLFGGR
ncbi:MAG TPA: oligosaccharide flippase family protein [Gemmatimonadota bacterium]|nr:oligosaccharide flippase family protein [Gemmatimonadota bacterium]